MREDDAREREDLILFDLDCVENPPRDEEEAQLREAVVSTPSDLRARIRLWNLLTRRRFAGVTVPDGELLEHALAFIEQAPFLGLTGWPWRTPGTPNELERFRKTWLGKLQTVVDDALSLENAFDFFYEWSFDECARVLEMALAAAPHRSTVHMRAGFFHWKGADLQTPGCSYRAAAFHMERADELAEFPGDPLDGHVALASFLAGSVDRAREIALRAIDARELNTSVEAHLGHTTLGLLALEEGDVLAAEERLLEAGSIKSNGRGPSFRLAQRLLNAGRREAVRGYLVATAYWEPTADWLALLDRGDWPVMLNPGR